MRRGKEILRELEAIKDSLTQTQIYSQVLREVIQRQNDQIKELHDRLMARTYPELKEYETLSEEVLSNKVYSVEDDENLAGEVVEGSAENG